MGLWAWAQQTLVPAIFPTQHYNGWPVEANDRNYLSDMSSWRIGPPRLRQLRMKKGHCLLLLSFSHFFLLHCIVVDFYFISFWSWFWMGRFSLVAGEVPLYNVIVHKLIDIRRRYLMCCIFKLYTKHFALFLSFAEHCKDIPYLFRKARCTNSYSSSTEDKDNYKPGWSSVANLSYFIDARTNHLDSYRMSFIYRTSEDLGGEPFDGYMASYSGGGYVANLGLTYESASDMIRNLSMGRWVDVYSRAVMVEFNVFNPGSRLANLVVVLFEYPSTGQIMWSRRVETVQLYRYTGSNGVVALISEVACAIFVLVITVFELRKICRSRMAYMRSFWNCIQLLTLVLFFVAVGLYTIRCLSTMKVVEKMMNHPGTTTTWMDIDIILYCVCRGR